MKNEASVNECIDLCVPGRLCLFGEHSDWAASYSGINDNIAPGKALIVGIEQDIKARAKKSKELRIQSVLPNGRKTEIFTAPMSVKILKEIASKGDFFSYTAGVAAYVAEYYSVEGISLYCYEMTLPIKKGLSSSAAICVLVARAFNKLYDLRLSIRGEMDIAYRGELMTQSHCGRLDQSCCFGRRPICMNFDKDSINVEYLKVGKELYWVFADLKAHKDTKKILSDLNRCYPFPQNNIEKKVHEALGTDNIRIITDAKRAMEDGDAIRIGQLMDEAQRIFDEKVMPASPEELKADKLHTVLKDPKIRNFVWGGKGVGSQGDGAVQLIAKSKEDQQNLAAFLSGNYKMEAFTLDIKPCNSVRKAVVPIAGFGTRMFPATRTIKKELFPVVDKDGLVKPVLLIILEELYDSGIEEICLIVSQDDREAIEAIFKSELTEEHRHKISPRMLEYEEKIHRIGERVSFAYQNERLGFGHAVYQSMSFSNNEPVLLFLGDHLFSSNSDKTCTRQAIEAYDLVGGELTVMICEVPLSHTSNFGIVCGSWLNHKENLMYATDIFEKPTPEYAKKNLAVSMKSGEKKFFSIFGQYILTPDVYEILAKNISEGKTENGEYQLTSALNEILHTKGMFAFVPSGKRYDIGNPAAYIHTISHFPKKSKIKMTVMNKRSSVISGISGVQNS